MLMIEGELTLPIVLRHLVGEACALVDARYGALGVLSENGTTLDQFLTVGLEPDEEFAIGARPSGRGVLGTLIIEAKPLRLGNIADSPDSYGFPPGHPPMTSFLGMPIKTRGEVYGNLYLTDKIGWSEFTSDDEALVGVLALSAGIAIENSRLNQRVQQAAVHEDRNRLARDLHDTVIQRLFAVGLSLKAMSTSAGTEGVADQINRAISDIDDTIRQVRSAIYELGTTGDEQGLRAQILALARDLRPVVGFNVDISFDGPVDSGVSDQISEHLLIAIREGITNVARHAHATQARIAVKVYDGICMLEISDDGRGLEQSATGGHGFGLSNLQHRAEKLHGKFWIEKSNEGGIKLNWQVPLRISDRADDGAP